MRVVVVGGGGFIGSHLVDALVARGDEVQVFDPFTSPAHPGGARPRWTNPAAAVCPADPRAACRRFAAVAGRTDALVHLAALTGSGQSMYEIARYSDVNATLSGWLAEQLVRGVVTPGRFVLASTRAVYGDGPGDCGACGRVALRPRTAAALRAGRWEPPCARCGGPARPVPVREHDVLAPLTPYAMTKVYAEQVLAFAGQVTGIPVTPLRLFNVYGPRQVPGNPYVGVVSAFAAAVLAGRPLTLFEDGLIVRDLVHVADVVAAVLAVIDADRPPCLPVNVGSGTAASLIDVARALGAAASREPVLRVSGESRVGDPRSVVADVTLAKDALGWSPRRSLAEGAASLVAWLRDVGQGAAAPLADAAHELRRHSLMLGAPSADRSDAGFVDRGHAA